MQYHIIYNELGNQTLSGFFIYLKNNQYILKKTIDNQ